MKGLVSLLICSLLGLTSHLAFADKEKEGDPVVVAFPGTCLSELDYTPNFAELGLTPDEREVDEPDDDEILGEVIIDDEEPPYRPMKIKWLRKKYGIKKVLKDKDKAVYRWANGYEIAFSTKKFSTYFEAMSFCNSLSVNGASYEVVSQIDAYQILINGLPFKSLRKSLVVHEKLLRSGLEYDDDVGRLRGGAMFWAKNSDFSNSPGQIFGFTNGTGDHIGEWQYINDLNARRAEMGLGAVNIPAVCVNPDSIPSR